MSDVAKYKSLITRQKAKLAYARKLLPKLERCVADVGPNPSYAEIARWLQEHRVRPGATARENAKWVAQTVSDYVHLDGIEPTPENLRGWNEETYGSAKSKKKKQSRDAGFRMTITVEWQKAEATLRHDKGEERHLFEMKKLADHIAEIEETAKALRSTLRIPE